MGIWRAVRGEGSKLRVWPEPRVLPSMYVFGTGSEEKGWWRDAVKLSMEWGEIAALLPLCRLVVVV